MEKNKKQAMILTLVAVITLIILVLGATYAYFQATGGNDASSNLNVITATTDLTTFKIDKAINVSVTQSEFAKGSGNKSDSIKAIATFTASNSVNVDKSSDRYNIYFIIENNDFIYTTNDTTPEILLNVTDPNGNKVENITGLIHTENGFDITTRTGGFLIIADYDIEANRAQTVSQEWNVEVTLVNLDTDQVKNMGKTLTGKLYLTREKMSSYELTKITNMETTTTYNSITTTLNMQEGSAQLDKYYFGIEKVSSNTTGYIQKQTPYIKPLAISDVKFIETDKPNYTFSNLDDNATYKVYSYGIDKNKIKTNIYETEITTNAYNNPKVNSITHTSTLNSITISVSASKGDNEIVKYFFSKDNGETYEESTTNSYVFSGLTDTTEYKIKVKVLDSYGRYSTEYFEAIATETYILPSVTSVSPSTKYNQISVSVVGAKGSYNVSKYYYSIDNGTYVELTTSSYTFTGLSEKTTHTIKVKVADTQGRMSNEYSLSATTDEYKVPTITKVTTTSTSSSITINITGQNGDGTINKYYYSKDNGSNYTESTSSSYTFSNLTSNTTFYIKVYVKDSNGRSSSVSTASVTTQIPTIADVCSNGTNLASCIKTFGNNGSEISNIYIHNSSLANGAGDNSYRYSGKNPKNYVCFGSTASSCPKDNLYRIIGVFGDQVKLIKWDYATSSLLGTNGDYKGQYTIGDDFYKGSNYANIGGYYWNKATSTNTWSNSNLNKTNLNTNFITNIGTEWANKIATTTWKVGGNTNANIREVVPATVYQNEIVNPTNNVTCSAKIGLMYASDYGFAADPSAWTLTMNSYNISTARKNWMCMGLYEWTISRTADYSNFAFSVYQDGLLGRNHVYNDNYDDDSFGVRPSFYLLSSITYVSGDGTYNNPIRIN